MTSINELTSQPTNQPINERPLHQMNLTKEQKKTYREELGRMEAKTIRDSRKRLSTVDFDSLAIIGRGAFGEVRRPPRPSSPFPYPWELLQNCVLQWC